RHYIVVMYLLPGESFTAVEYNLPHLRFPLISKYLVLLVPEEDNEVRKSPVFDIEITSNRVDSASVLGIARESSAILPQFNMQARFKENLLKKYKFSYIEKPKTRKKLHITIAAAQIAPRISAVVLDGISVKQSQPELARRLTACGERPINNLVDISNYVRIALGHPVHIFDFDKIAGHSMTIQKSKKGEVVTTIDGREFVLPGNDIIIKDESGKIIDLAGLMGAKLSGVSKHTTSIVVFVPNFNGKLIRHTSMKTGQRTAAAAFFEKGIDPELTETALVYAYELLEKHAGAQIASRVIDIYPHRRKLKRIRVSIKQINKLIGTDIPSKKIRSILTRLGFSPSGKNILGLSIPSYRAEDISIWEDVAEEVIRIYGYHNLPSHVQQTDVVKQPKHIYEQFRLERVSRLLLKHLGLHETYNYSMIPKKQIKAFGLTLGNHLKLANPISEELLYLRTSLIPSLAQNIADNYGKSDVLKFFEIAHVYNPHENALPDEVRTLGIAVNTSFFDLKGIVESLLAELSIPAEFVPNTSIHMLSKNVQAQLKTLSGTKLGIIGKLGQTHRSRLSLSEDIYCAQLDVENLIASKVQKSYKPINPYARVKLDLTVSMKKNLSYQALVDSVKKSSSLCRKIELHNSYKNKLTLRLYFERLDRNITESQAKSELEKIKKNLK
ncbi:MAG: phenylalanine--tRNA ligase subunit beta, partial [Candidatus Paceibacterota bacterium]